MALIYKFDDGYYLIKRPLKKYGKRIHFNSEGLYKNVWHLHKYIFIKGICVPKELLGKKIKFKVEIQNVKK